MEIIQFKRFKYEIWAKSIAVGRKPAREAEPKPKGDGESR